MFWGPLQSVRHQEEQPGALSTLWRSTLIGGQENAGSSHVEHHPSCLHGTF